MSKLLTALLVFCMSVSLFPVNLFAESTMEEEELLFGEIPVVITASKGKQALNEATSIVSVITKEEISRSGVRSVYELLRRVPGFFPSRQITWPLIGMRGFVTDANDQIMFLIDGHPMNSIVRAGFQQQDLIPALEKVEKIEIIRGPGSVLWGSNATTAIINVITKDTLNQAENNKVTVGYAEKDGLFHTNYLTSVGEQDSGVSGIVSASYWQAKGYDVPGRDRMMGMWWEWWDFGAGQPKVDPNTIKGNYWTHDYGKAGTWMEIDRMRDGYEVYAKLKTDKGGRLLARLSRTSIDHAWDDGFSWDDTPGDVIATDAYVDYQKSVQLSDNINLESTIYGHHKQQTRNMESIFLKIPKQASELLNEETAFSGEFLANLNIIKDNSLKVGVKAVRTKVGPNYAIPVEYGYNFVYTTTTVAYTAQPGWDNQLAAYFEDMYRFNDNTSVFGGARYDWNDFRSDKAVVLPRGGVIHKLSDELTAKYVYNTGLLRPLVYYTKQYSTADINRATKPEEVQSHDAQLYYAKGQNFAALTAYQMNLDNLISVNNGYVNFGRGQSYGAELEGKYFLSPEIDVYANYSYTKATVENVPGQQFFIANAKDEVMNIPRHTFNVGTDYLFDLLGGNHILNVHVNGWMDMPVIKPALAGSGQSWLGDGSYGQWSYGSLPGEYYLDVSLSSRGILKSPVDLTLYVKNALDNTNPVGLMINNGYYYPAGRNAGVMLSVNF